MPNNPLIVRRGTTIVRVVTMYISSITFDGATLEPFFSGDETDFYEVPTGASIVVTPQNNHTTISVYDGSPMNNAFLENMGEPVTFPAFGQTMFVDASD